LKLKDQKNMVYLWIFYFYYYYYYPLTSKFNCIITLIQYLKKRMVLNYDDDVVKLTDAAEQILERITKIHNKTNDRLIAYAMKFDTVVVGMLANRSVVVAMNVVKHENPNHLEFKVMQEGSSENKIENKNYRNSLKLDINGSKCGFQNEYVAAIKNVLKSDKLYLLQIVPLYDNIALDHRKYHREFHAEMQIVEFASIKNQPLIAMGISKPICDECKQILGHSVHYNKLVGKKPKNWLPPFNEMYTLMYYKLVCL